MEEREKERGGRRIGKGRERKEEKARGEGRKVGGGGRVER